MRDPQSLMSVLEYLPRLSDQQLQQVATQYKSKPDGAAVVAAVLAEKQNRGKIRQSAQPPADPNQPTVADQVIPGISQLPAPNMQFAGGGIVAFADGGETDDLRMYTREQARGLGLDPDRAVRQFTAESNYNPNAVSPKGAKGISQLMDATASGYGLAPGDIMNPHKNVSAGLRFAADLKRKYNDPVKELAAYNMGETKLNKHLAANNGEVNFEKLPKETQGYVAKILSMLPMSGAQAAQRNYPEPTPGPSPQEQAGMAALYSQYQPRMPLQAQSYGQMVGPMVSGAPLNANASPQEAQSPVPNQLNNIGVQQSLANMGQQNPNFQRNQAPVELGQGQKPAWSPAQAQGAPAQQGNPMMPGGIDPYSEANRRARAFDVVPSAPAAPASKKEFNAGVEQAKEVLPPEQRKGWSDDMLWTFFANLAAGTSPYAAVNLGNAVKSAYETKRDTEKMDAQRKLYEAQTAHYGKEPDQLTFLRALAKDPKLMAAQESLYESKSQKASPYITGLRQQAVDINKQLSSGAFMLPDQRAKLEQRLQQVQGELAKYEGYGDTMPQQPAAPSGAGWGIRQLP